MPTRTRLGTSIGSVLVIVAALAASPFYEDCNKQLDGDSAVAECAGNWTDCASSPPAVSCCSHWHAAMNWKNCETAGSETGYECGTPAVKKYKRRDGYCDSGSCITGSYSNCPLHSEDDYTGVLEACPVNQ